MRDGALPQGLRRQQGRADDMTKDRVSLLSSQRLWSADQRSPINEVVFSSRHGTCAVRPAPGCSLHALLLRTCSCIQRQTKTVRSVGWSFFGTSLLSFSIIVRWCDDELCQVVDRHYPRVWPFNGGRTIRWHASTVTIIGREHLLYAFSVSSLWS